MIEGSHYHQSTEGCSGKNKKGTFDCMTNFGKKKSKKKKEATINNTIHIALKQIQFNLDWLYFCAHQKLLFCLWELRTASQKE